MVSIVILLIVFILIAVRKIGNIRLQIWQIMLIGALAALFTGQISPAAAVKAINLDVMLFLFGMFVVGQALEESGYLSSLSFRLFGRAGSLNGLIFFILFGMGMLSALLMNDTIAIIGTPLVLLLAKRNGLPPQILLLALAFAVTIGSVMSPIGNPQNLLIAVDGNVASPFITFARFLLLPTIVNLFLAYVLIRVFYREHFRPRLLAQSPAPITDKRLATLSQISLALLVVLVLTKIVISFSGSEFDFKLTYIALIAAFPVLLSRKRLGIISRIDWSTLVFFAAMFILMESVWDSGFFQGVLAAMNLNLASTNTILAISVLLSQLISNVPLVALYLPMLDQLGVSAAKMMALAAGSTIAGNFSILGAASNVIIIQNAEKRAGITLTFLEFVKIGIPLTVLNLAVYWVFLSARLVL